jgi:N-acetyl-anhydromuramyl-L-alanine amidase AmpD
MCCKKNSNGEWYIEQKTIANTIELVKDLMKKYNIAPDNVVRHYDVTHKICPEPFVRNPKLWEEFKSKLNEKENEPMLTLEEAMYFLNKEGIIDKPEHWKYMCDNVKDLQYVFIKCANRISKYEAGD